MSATWIADALRAGGCAVDETVVPDWKTRGHTDGPTMTNVVGVMGHHTAGAATGNLPSLSIVRDGRPDLAGPLANLMLARNGTWVPIAAGRPWHAGAADKPANFPWVPNGDANGCVLGIEAESAGTGDWTAAQIAAYPQGVAALLKYRNLPASRFIGHKEWAPSRKPDPHGWPGDMAAFRTTVTNHLNGATDMPLNDADAQLVAKYVAPAVWTYVRDGAGPAWVVDRVVGIDAKTGSLGPIATDLAAVKQTVASLQAGSAQVDVNALATALANNPAAINALGDAIASALSSRLGNG